METGFLRYAYRPFDNRWLYWEAETKLLDRKRTEYKPHVFEGNLWLVTQQKPRREWSPPQVISRMGCYDLMDRNASCFPESLLDDGLGLGPRRKAIWAPEPVGLPRIATSNGWGLGVEDLFHHVLAVLHDPAYREANAGALTDGVAAHPGPRLARRRGRGG